MTTGDASNIRPDHAKAPPPRRPGVPLKDRRASTGAQTAPASALPAPTMRHVWVHNPAQPSAGPPEWVEGLLLRWEQDQHGLCGQVSYVVEDEGSPVLVTQILPRRLIRPAASGPSPDAPPRASTSGPPT
ncbi:MAG: hypothetical protein ACOYBY_15295 [Dermatophilaceae bacterium]